MINSSERQWAIAMKKNQQRTKMPVSVRKKNILEKIDWLKAELKKHLQNHNKIQIKETCQELIQLRARLAVLQILEIQEVSGYIDDDEKNNIVSAYTKDCLKLKTSLNKFYK